MPLILVVVDNWGDGNVKRCQMSEQNGTLCAREYSRVPCVVELWRSIAAVGERTASVVAGEGTHLAPLVPQDPPPVRVQCSVQCAEAA